MPLQFRIARSFVGLGRLLGKPERVTRLAKAVLDDALPVGLALRSDAFGGRGEVAATAPAFAFPPVAPIAIAEPEVSLYAKAKLQSSIPASGRITPAPVPSTASTSSRAKAAQAEATPPSQAHAAPTRTSTGAAEREEIEDASAKEEEG